MRQIRKQVKYCEVRKNGIPIALAPYKDPENVEDWQGQEYTFHYPKNLDRKEKQAIIDAIRDNSRPVIYDVFKNLDPKNLPSNFGEILVDFLQTRIPIK